MDTHDPAGNIGIASPGPHMEEVKPDTNVFELSCHQLEAAAAPYPYAQEKCKLCRERNATGPYGNYMQKSLGSGNETYALKASGRHTDLTAYVRTHR